MKLRIPCVLLAAAAVLSSANAKASTDTSHSNSIFGVKSLLDSAYGMLSGHAEELRSLSSNFRAREVLEGTKTLFRSYSGRSSAAFAPSVMKARSAAAASAQTVRHRELDAVLGPKRNHAAHGFARRVLAQQGIKHEFALVGATGLPKQSIHADGASNARVLQATSQPTETISPPGDKQCSYIGRLVQLNTTTDVCAGVDVTPVQQATITGAVTTLNNANLDGATRTAANAAVVGVPGVGGAVFTAAVDANTPLPAGFDINGPLSPAQVAAVVAAANVSSAANITTFAQLAPAVSTNDSAIANGTISAGQLLLSLPLNVSAALVGAVTCEQRVTVGTICQCPLDYVGGTNCTARAWGCSLQWNEPQVDACIASNAALPGLDLSATPPSPLSRTAILEYSSAAFGLPPCAFYDVAQSSLDIRLASTCAFRSDTGVAEAPPTATCNGSSMDADFFGGAAALAAAPLKASQAPYFGFTCIEAQYAYSTGGSDAVNWGARLPENITAEQLPLQMPFSVTALQAADAQRLQVQGRLAAVDWQVLSDTSAGANVTMALGAWAAFLAQSGGALPTGSPVSADSDTRVLYDNNGLLQVSMSATLPTGSFQGRFAVGGRALVYGELTQLRSTLGGVALVGVATGNESTLLERAPFRAAAVGPFVFDERSYVEPEAEKPSILVAVLVPTLLVLLAAAGGVVLWRHRKNKAIADKAQLEREGFGLFSGEHDEVAAARRQAALRSQVSSSKALAQAGGAGAEDSKRGPGAAESKASPGRQ